MHPVSQGLEPPGSIPVRFSRLGNAVPEHAELGYHLCYGTPNDEHVVMPTDLANTVETTHGILAGLERLRAVEHDRIVGAVNLDPPNPGSDAFHAKMGFAQVGCAELAPGGKTARYREELP